MKSYKLYYHRNIINNKYYVGITSKKNVIHRWGKDGNNYSTQIFSRAIEKYGWDNFEHVILFDNLDEEEAKILEQQYILEFNSLIPNGYNMTLGGETTYKNNGIICLETKEIFSKDNVIDFLNNHPELKEKYNEQDIVDCCNFQMKRIKIPWKNEYYHFTYNRFNPILTVEQAEECFKDKVLRNKRYNVNYINGRRFKKNGIQKVKKTCKLCGELFIYPLYNEEGRKQHPNYCNKCNRRDKT